MKLTLYPDPILKKRAEVVTEFSAALARKIKVMYEIMDRSEGIGLAGPQAGWSARVFVTRIPEGQTSGPYRVYINPEIIEASGEAEGEEGCLSFPDIQGTIVRPDTVLIRAMDVEGQLFEESGTGLTARCWQHEIDHLDGILFISRMGLGDKLKNKAKLRALQKEFTPKRSTQTKTRRPAR